MPKIRIAIVDLPELTQVGLEALLVRGPGTTLEIVSVECDPPPAVILYGADEGGDHDPALHSLLRRTSSIVILTHWSDCAPALEVGLACGAEASLSLALPSGQLVAQIEHFAQRDARRRPPPRDGACHPDIARLGLTQREVDVLGLVAQGLSNREIAEQLFLTLNTIKSYIRGAYRKIGVERRSQAVLWAEPRGLAPSFAEGASSQVDQQILAR